jgi:RNA polymerase sigma factor (sigma-70 family)
VRISREEIEAARRGDPSAREALMRKLEPIVANLLLPLRRGSGNLARIDWEGLQQDLLLELLKRLPSFRGQDGARLLAWLSRIVQSRYQDALRKRGSPGAASERPLSLDAAPEALELQDSAQSPLDAASSAEDAELVMRAMAGLPLPCRRLIELREWERLPFELVAERLGLGSAEAARAGHRRAMSRLEAAVGELRESERGQGTRFP